MTAEFIDSGIQPDGFPQIKCIAGFFQGMKYFVCARILTIITDDSVLDQMIVFEDLYPETKHKNAPFCMDSAADPAVSISIAVFILIVKYGL